MRGDPVKARIVRFDRPRPLTDYMENGRPAIGYEQGGHVLAPIALDALAVAKTSGEPCEIVAIGEEHLSDGRYFLLLGVCREHIEATTDYRHIEHKGLTYVCPECQRHSDVHSKTCSLR